MSGEYRGLYDPKVRDMVRKGLRSPSAEAMGNTQGLVKRGRDHSMDAISHRKYLCGLETLICYFDEEWFDLKTDYIDRIQKGRGNLVLNQPQRCPKCNKAWAIENGKQYELDEEVYHNLPMERKECGC